MQNFEQKVFEQFCKEREVQKLCYRSR